jgi:hypothetical protein
VKVCMAGHNLHSTAKAPSHDVRGPSQSHPVVDITTANLNIGTSPVGQYRE